MKMLIDVREANKKGRVLYYSFAILGFALCHVFLDLINSISQKHTSKYSS